MILFGNLNVNWSDKSKRKELKTVVSKYDLSQIIVGPTRVTRTTQTQIDLAFTNYLTV